MALAEEGKAFLLQGGDCAEDFDACNAIAIRESLKTILQMSAVLTFAGKKPIVKVGRIAGQYAKPRSSDIEVIDGVEMPSYRGDNVNSPESTLEARTPDPERMLDGYFHSAATLNLVRAFVHGGFADIHKIHLWNRDFINKSKLGEKYDQLVQDIDQSLAFMNSCGMGGNPALSEVDFFTSHEALLLDYEKAMTRRDSLSGEFYDCSAHMLWIGDRTRSLDSAHVEFLRGIKNPIGIKVGPTTDVAELLEILELLNPENERGRINLITRFGAEKIDALLPDIVKEVAEAGCHVLWSCDPMHGNTFTSTTQLKTRDFDAIKSEITSFFNIHHALGTVPGGVHFELTGLDVTEIKGGVQQIDDEGLKSCYRTNCDPRLNGNQSLEMAFEITKLLNKK
jgi:3-deoxy-7-phosphoheptulonate synthase